MKAKTLTFVIVLAVMAMLLSGTVTAQEPKPPEPTPPASPSWQFSRPVPAFGQLDGNTPLAPHQAPEKYWAMLEGTDLFMSGTASVAPQATGGPDEFGYTWDDAVPFTWVDVISGVETSLAGDDTFFGPVDIGFPFKFYENTYAQLYISTNGLVTFGEGTPRSSNQSIPNPASPNNFIAVFWDDLTIGSPYNPGKVYYRSGGTAPNRYLAIAWYNATSCCATDARDYKTFEVVLYENGDIIMLYLWLSGYLQSATVGIEDDVGITGLQYLYNAAGLETNKAIRFYRPAPMARVKSWPPYHGRFTSAGEMAAFQIPIRNTGELGADTYDLTTSSAWPVSLYAADGTTPLTDSDGDGHLDTGPVAQGNTCNIIVKVQTPVIAAVGANNSATITARSSRNTGKKQTITLQTAVPAPFAQVYQDGADGAMSLYLAQPAGQAVRKATADRHSGSNMAVTETPNGNFIYVWSKSRCLDATCSTNVEEIEYALLDRHGQVVRPWSRLTNHSGASLNTYDFSPAVAVAPDGRIGMLWTRQLWDSANSRINFNIYFAVLDAAGNLLFGPTNLTNIITWGTWDELYVPRFSSPRIAATGDNRFLLAWERYYYGPPTGNCTSYCSVHDILYAIRSADGSQIRPIIQFTSDTPGWDQDYGYPAMTALRNNRALLAWRQTVGGGSSIAYAVLDSDGNMVRAPIAFNMDGFGPDAAELSDGRIAIAWSSLPPLNPGEGPWTARYYNNETLTEPAVLVRTDPTINFDWWDRAPAPGVNPDYFSVRWTGTITVDADVYVFTMGSDDGSRLWIDGQLIMDHWGECCTYWTAVVPLSAGPHQVRMEMHEHYGAAWAYLSWQKQGQKRATTVAILDAAYNSVSGPTRLNNPAALTGDLYVSVTADASGRAILTWMDSDYFNRRNLYYALVDSSGNVLTPPMIFRSTQAANPYLFTSYQGYGNTTYRWTPPSGVDGMVTFETPLSGGLPGGNAPLGLRYANYGAKTATGVVLTATLGDDLSYVRDTSGVLPNVAGNQVVWRLPDLRLLESQGFTLYVQVPTDAAYGTRYPITLSLTSDGPEADSSNNTASAQVMAARQVFLPLVLRGY